MDTTNNKMVLIKKLLQCGVIQTGDFTLKSGAKSNVYLDLRRLYSYPEVIGDISKKLYQLRGTYPFHLVCGVPTAGVPYATLMSNFYGAPMITVRKEKKGHGMNKLVEGTYYPGDRVLLVEDVVTSGSSILETAKILEDHELIVEHITCIVDRRSDGDDGDGRKVGNYPLYSLLTLSDILDVLNIPNGMKERELYHPVAQKLWSIMIAKKSNLALSVDLDSINDVIRLVEKVGRELCMVKIHYDIYQYEVGENILMGRMNRLNKLAELYNFLILDDSKYADIGYIVNKQLTSNIEKYGGGANLITVHGIFGESTLEGLVPPCQSHGIGCLLVVSGSAQTNFMSTEYSEKVYQMGLNHDGGIVAGFITQKRQDNQSDHYLYCTPGVHLTQKDDRGSNRSDAVTQNYRTIEDAVFRDRCDVIIVGRGIYAADNPVAAAKEYRELGWQSLLQRYQ